MNIFEMILGGHPDKVCDIIAERLKEKTDGKSAIEVVWFDDNIIIGGEVGKVLKNHIILDVVFDVLQELGYNENISVRSFLQTQSQEIADIVKNNGAGDNGIFFAGYHALWSPIVRKLKSLAKHLTATAKYYKYRTDGKFIAAFGSDYKLINFTLNIASQKHQNETLRKEFEESLKNMLSFSFNVPNKLAINPKGLWYKCGGFADSGLTGRKLACDNSMGLFHQGGGAFFGKDVSKADYSVPLFLYHKAESYIFNNQIETVELVAHTIIGDNRVDIYTTQNEHLGRYTFSEIMEFAKNNPMDWTGL